MPIRSTVNTTGPSASTERTYRMRSLTVCTTFLWILIQSSDAFLVPVARSSRTRTVAQLRTGSTIRSDESSLSRRDWLTSIVVVGTAICAPDQATAVEEQVAVAVPMKDFVDPLFTISIPKGYFALRRSAKGDLPDVKTGQGRRGSSIFTAGDMGKAEVVAVERFPTRLLLEENGIEATGSLSTFPALGEPSAVANLINLRREREKPGMSSTQLVQGSISVSPDGKDLMFKLKTEIDVQKPELLMEQSGINQLFRITSAKASLRANDGNIMAVFASALEQDFNGPDGEALQEAVSSFQALDQSTVVAAF